MKNSHIMSLVLLENPLKFLSLFIYKKLNNKKTKTKLPVISVATYKFIWTWVLRLLVLNSFQCSSHLQPHEPIWEWLPDHFSSGIHIYMYTAYLLFESNMFKHFLTLFTELISLLNMSLTWPYGTSMSPKTSSFTEVY